jgi:hypothetical protein
MFAIMVTTTPLEKGTTLDKGARERADGISF